jgi:hypothetical protein
MVSRVKIVDFEVTDIQINYWNLVSKQRTIRREGNRSPEH